MGKKFWARSPHGDKIKAKVGPARDYLSSPECLSGGRFDLVVLDADKDGMWNYYTALRDSGMLSAKCAVVIDTTPHKGQPPDRYIKYQQADRWVNNSGQKVI